MLILNVFWDVKYRIVRAFYTEVCGLESHLANALTH